MKKKTLWIPVVVMVFLIFGNSSASAGTSNGMSLGIIDQILPLLNSLGWYPDIDFLNFIVRKLAHFSEYAVLGCLIGAAWKLQPFAWMQAPVSLLPFYLIPVIDENIQRFSQGRSCEVRDMLIDSSGLLTGMLLVLAALAYSRRRIKRTRRNHR